MKFDLNFYSNFTSHKKDFLLTSKKLETVWLRDQLGNLNNPKDNESTWLWSGAWTPPPSLCALSFFGKHQFSAVLLKGNHKIFVENFPPPLRLYVNIMILFSFNRCGKSQISFSFDISDLNVSHEDFQLILNNAFSIGLGESFWLIFEENLCA